MTLDSNRRVLLIGWDAADWKVIHPLLDSGKMPNLERIVNGGVIGNLATIRPVLSPMVWTSIATGKRPFRHGIHGFTEPDPVGGGVRPVSVLSRRTKAIWNILGQEGARCNVIGWWPSHPAEPIRGVMVSDQFQKAVGPLEEPWPLRPGTVHPPELGRLLAPLRVHPGELSEDLIGPFVPELARVDQDKDHRLQAIAKILSECAGVHAAATAVIQNEPWQFMAVYFDGIDHFCHGFMKYHPPRLPWVGEKDFELYRGVVEGAYRFHDMMLGAYLALTDEETTVILVSDHGFHSDHLRPKGRPNEPAGPAAEHRPLGIFAMRGPGIRVDERVTGASVLDVAPTILSLFGLPVGRDMDGKVLANAFTTPPAIETVESWDPVPGEHGMHPPDRRIDPVDASAAIDQLVALGYVEKPSENRARAVEQTVRELRYNLACSYADADRHAEAAEIFEELVERFPYEHRIGLALVRCRLQQGRAEDARRIMEGILERKREDAGEARRELAGLREELAKKPPDDWSQADRRRMAKLRSRAGENPYGIHYLMGSVLFADGDEAGALEHLAAAERIQSSIPDLHVLTGDVYLKMKRWEEARGSFARAIELDPENGPGWFGLARSDLALRRNRSAAEAALRSVALYHHNPRAHHVLGIALHRMGRPEEAEKALEVSLALNPNNAAAHRRLAHLNEKRLGDPEKAKVHRQAAKEAGVAAREWKRRVRQRREGGDRVAAGPLPAFPTEPEAASAPAAPFDPERSVVVVSGLPRSGTSMMMQMLEAGGMAILTDGRRVADEDNPRGYFEFEKATTLRRNRSWLAGAGGKAVKIVAPLLSLLPRGPDYRVVFMERRLEEVLASQRIMIERRGGRHSDVPPERLAGEFARQVREARRNLRARGIPCLTVGYAECLRDPTAVAGRVSAFLGSCLSVVDAAGVVDPSLHRQRADRSG